MARVKTRQELEIEKLKKAAAVLGIDWHELLKTMPLTSFGSEAIERSSMEAESAIYYIKTKGKEFSAKICAHCGEAFSATYHAVQYCSDDCRAYVLEGMGLIWNHKAKEDHERWNIKNKGYIPKIIGVAATGVLNELERTNHES